MRKILLLLLLQIIIYHALATDFTVTSNANAGPGTLRQALIDAANNGIATQDRIIFNIADQSEAGRTITLQAKLPDVSSNLVIDGTTQPGATMGPGDAKICLTANRLVFYNTINPFMAALLIYKQADVAVYGLQITNFYDLGYTAGVYPAILINESQNIQIGAPNKGNWIHNCDYFILSQGMYESYSNINCTNIRIQSNYFGYETNQLSYGTNGLVMNCTNLTIGGTLTEEGNHIADGMELYGDNIKISNNINGIDGFGNMSKYQLHSWTVGNAKNLEVSYNKSVRLNLNLNLVTNFKIFANTDSSPIYLGSLGAVGMFNCSDGIIGSEDENLKNVFGSYTGSSFDYLTSVISSSGSKNIQILKNEIICTLHPYVINTNYTVDAGIPQIKVLVNTDSEYSGTASPLSDVYIYYDNTGCAVCSPIVFFTKAKADAAGNWKITGNFTGKRWIANALLVASSSEFTNPYVDVFGYAKFTQPSCGQNNGTIELISPKNTLRVEWYNANNIKVGEGFKIENLGPGNYYPILYNGNCAFKVSYPVYLNDVTPVIDDKNLVKTNSSCGQDNGSVKGLYVTNYTNKPLTIKWTDPANNIVGQNIDVYNLKPGVYSLSVTDANQCTQTYGPVTIINTTGPNIDQSTSTITPTNCGESKGAITNITATGTGTLKYIWKNAAQTQVGNTQDLLNQPAGTYTLQVTDDTNCGPVYTSAITIPELNGITIDESAAILSPVACDANSAGTVKGIKITGATKYQWFNATNAEVGISADLTTAIPGNYYLVASNNTCSKQSKLYTIVKHINNKTYRFTSTTTTYATCNIDNGHIEVVLNAANDQPVTYRWVNAQGATVGTTLNINNLPVNTYTLYGADEFGCEKQIHTTNLIRVPALNVVSTNITADRCGQNKGSIHITRLTGGRPPFIFSWKNSAGATIATTADIDNLSAGAYTLNVTDQTDCGLFTGQYIVDDTPLPLSPPPVTDLQLCSAGEALLTINNVMPGRGYRLYDSANGLSPIGDEQSGKFKINVTAATSYYVSQYIGTCESSRAEVKVRLGGLSTIKMPNTFSPNGDGINDTWKIPGVENYPTANVQVFTRSGQKVFESTGYTQPFDGKYDGKDLPSGNYYYIINLNSGCGLLSGSITIIR